MKALPFKISKPDQIGLIFQEDLEQIFYDKFHQHEEIQVSLIVQGEGTLIIGDTINYYKKGEIVVIGSNLPHVFKSEILENEKSHMLTLFFTREAFGNEFFNLEELNEVKSLMEKTVNGLKFNIDSDELKELFFNLKKGSKLEKFISLLEILKRLSKLESTSLSSFIYERKYSDIEGKRMRDIMAYTINNYQKDISLEDVAHEASLTKNAFCKYFKKRTNKTYFRFLNEFRIAKSCKLLISKEGHSIAEIAYLSGFNNLSYFNRTFKLIKNTTPLHYKITHMT